MSDKKYLVFAGDSDEGYYPVDDLNHLIGEMSMEDAHKAIKGHPEKSGIIAIIENGKVIERLQFFEDITSSVEGISTKSGFRIDEHNTIYLEDTFKSYTITADDLTALANQAAASEKGQFDRFDFSINGRLAIYYTYRDKNDRIGAVLSTSILFEDRETIARAITDATIRSFTAHRDWIDRGSPTVKATGMFGL